ncbi:MAG: hypothetical protein K2W95_26085 [Candidatus Obscuribacterales bacterium]|nr:hypothetical protein [Candidatus Obscuribacterales bacterium]
MSEPLNFDPPDQPVKLPSRRKLGLRLAVQQNATIDKDGVPKPAIFVTQAFTDQSGFQAGIRDADLILQIDGIAVDDLRGNLPDLLEAFSSFIRTHEIGEVIVLQIKRGEELFDLKVKM